MTKLTGRDYDAIVDDYVHATTDSKKADLLSELADFGERLAAAHLADGQINEYQRATGYVRQAHANSHLSDHTTRVLMRMQRRAQHIADAAANAGGAR